jgi:hypothetical protein
MYDVFSEYGITRFEYYYVKYLTGISAFTGFIYGGMRVQREASARYIKYNKTRAYLTKYDSMVCCCCCVWDLLLFL